MYELVILSLGSNLGDREENLASAITSLGTFHQITDIKAASFYESEPLYNTDQPKFLNTIISCNSSLNNKFSGVVCSIRVILPAICSISVTS